MNVLHVYKRYLPDSVGGVEQTIFQLASATSRAGVHNTVLCLSQDPKPRVLERDEAVVVRCPIQFDKASTPFGLDYITEYRRRAAEADILHYHFPYPVQDALHVLCNAKKPALVTYHSDIVRQKLLSILYAPLMHLFLRRVQSIVATSDNYLRTSPTLQRHRDKTTVIPIGLSREFIPQVSEQRLSSWRKRLGDSFFFFVGVFRYYKGLHFLLEAARSKRQRIVLAGSGPLEAELKGLAQAQGLDNLIFLGAISDEDKAALLSLCRAVVFPSHLRSEAFGITLVEGAMFGKPLICAEIGTGATFINIHNETGIVVRPADSESLGQAMDTLQNDADLAAKYGANAARRYEKHFSAERMASAYLALYQRLHCNADAP